MLSVGRLTVNVLPSPSWLATITVPPWASTMNLTMLNPSPQPSAERDRLRSTW